eukprot:scaffold1197_cov46-Attheya_sp.AAC.2
MKAIGTMTRKMVRALTRGPMGAVTKEYDKRHGDGKMVYKDGNIHECNEKENMKDCEGTLRYADGFVKNFNFIRSGLQRTKEHVILREKMDGMPESQIQAALKDLDARDEATNAAELNNDLSSKISNEMD